jgi:signal transduction histidine kinase/CheY-like chemotaxis protein
VRIKRTDRFRAEQIRLLYRSGSVGVVGAMGGALILAFITLHMRVQPLAIVQLWFVSLASIAAVHLLLMRAYSRATSQLSLWRQWAGWFVALSLLEGTMWGLTAFNSPENLAQNLFTMLCMCAVTAGSGAAFGVYLPAYCAFLFPATVPFLAVSAARGGTLHYHLAAMMLVYIAGIFMVQYAYNSNFQETIQMRFENADLAEKLRLQKEAAEEANRAKSRFLAAASHDLRQPVHALTMFVETLRGCNLAPEPRRLVAHIGESVAAMDELFSALLDISKLDAGVVEPQLQSFAIQALFERLGRNYAAEAAGKGLELRFCPCSLSVRSDPLLLERILGNLISNAIRYTRSGRVVVGCRRGTLLRLQVWDTGCGIPAERTESIFQEFFQLQNPERDRTKGLGLGLAIVRRLTAFLDHPLSVSSVPGGGSVFTVSVPAADSADPPELSGPQTISATDHGLILVIDDETAIQEAMRSLLTSWGHDVITAGSGSEMTERLVSCPARPNLIICDFRLREEENAIAIIRQLQSEYNEEIPAMLISGDTAPDRLNEARRSGFLLLHKPVPGSKLRAAIGNLMTKECL